MTGYLMARVVPMPALGWMTGVLGNRRLYVIGVLGTTVATVLCGMAWNMASLIFFRILQGAIGAQVMGLGMVMLYEAFPVHQRGLAMGLFILVASLGPTIGQLLGGYLVQEVSWRAIFFLAVPSGVVGTILALTTIPHDAPRGQKTIDLPGLGTMTVFLVAILLALSQGQRTGWDSTYIVSLLGLSGLCLAMFIAIERRVAHPMVHLRLYRNCPFVMASLVALMVQLVFDFPPVQAGLILAPGAIFMGLIGFGSGRLADHLPPRYLVVAGLALFALDMYYFASLSLLVSVSTMAWLVMLQRGSFGMIFSASDTAVMRTLPDDDRPMGAGLHNLHRGMAMAFGVALCSLLLEQRLAFHTLQYSDAHEQFALPVQESLEAARHLLLEAGETVHTAPTTALAVVANVLGEQTRIAAYQDCFLAVGGVFLLALLPAWLSQSHSPRQRSTPVPVPPAPTPHAPAHTEERATA
jgi:DHA2 family multidrug resistance protein